MSEADYPGSQHLIGLGLVLFARPETCEPSAATAAAGVAATARTNINQTNRRNIRMNRQLLHRIADHIDAMPESFDLSLWADKAPKANICDTVGCVAGWAVMISEPITRQAVALGAISLDHFPWDARATKALDLPAREADTLFASNAWWGTHMRAFGFEPADGWDDWDDDYVALGAVTPKAAAHILRALADGEINLGGDWPND